MQTQASLNSTEIPVLPVPPVVQWEEASSTTLAALTGNLAALRIQVVLQCKQNT